MLNFGNEVPSRNAPAPGAPGVGLRSVHYPYLLEHTDLRIQWFEAISENYMDSKGRPLFMLEHIRKNFPLALHGVSLSAGSADGISPEYVRRLKALVDRVEPFLVSDHLAWTRIDGQNLHDLLPLPCTQEALEIFCANLNQAQDILGRNIAIENPSTYLAFRQSEMPEWEFLVRAAKNCSTGILLDINNIFVSASNHGFDPREYIEAVPSELVRQMHLGGHTDMGTHLFDTHSRPVTDEVWDLFTFAARKFHQAPILIEWDEDIPEFTRVEEEALKAGAILRSFQ